MSMATWALGVLGGALGCFALGASAVNAQGHPDKDGRRGALSADEVALARISAYTARGNLSSLDAELRNGLGAGLTVNQIKSALEQLYAYCGFPRSLNGLSRLMAVVKDRKQQGFQDKQGKTHEPLVTGDRYERGRLILEKLTGTPQRKPAPGFGEFSPEIDRFLKEHLFADIFENPILSYRQRELVTIAALASMEGVEAQLKAHVGIGRNVGITDAELIQLADLVDGAAGRTQANGLRELLGQARQPVIERELLVRICEITVAPEARQEYVSILRAQAQKSVESEPGVISIFPMAPSDDRTQVRIVEIYKDRAAYEAHIASPHFRHYKAATSHMVTSLKLIDMAVLDGDSVQKIFAKLQ